MTTGFYSAYKIYTTECRLTWKYCTVYTGIDARKVNFCCGCTAIYNYILMYIYKERERVMQGRKKTHSLL